MAGQLLITGRFGAVVDAAHALRTSVDRLAGLMHPLDETGIVRRAYPKEWTIADVMSHLGSGAVIASQMLQASLDHLEPLDDFNQRVWDEWNAKSPRAKVDDAMLVDADLMSAFEATDPDDQARFKAAMGPLELDWDAFVGLRLNEHLLHEWDIAVALDPTASLASDGADVVVDNLELIAKFTAKPRGNPRTISIKTTQPERWFLATIKPSQVGFSSTEGEGEPDLSMPAESLIRLVYGRLDPDHTPALVADNHALLDQLREVFPGP
jgi:uncharacterized protein (TIGR03083 family)